MHADVPIKQSLRCQPVQNAAPDQVRRKGTQQKDVRQLSLGLKQKTQHLSCT